jgi:hypothetical protein
MPSPRPRLRAATLAPMAPPPEGLPGRGTVTAPAALRFTPIPGADQSPAARRVIALRERDPELAWQIESRACESEKCNAGPGEVCRNRNGAITWYHVCRTGNEGDGNPPALGAGNTQFDSEVPDHGSLAQTVERPAENGQVGGSITPGATMRM